MNNQSQNYINHVALVLDASVSMAKHVDAVRHVADSLVKGLAEKSKELNQETRLTVYLFGEPDKLRCIFYDMDVLRLPSLRDIYAATDKSTALIDAGIKSIKDLQQTATLYGDHAFLVYLLTDGIENSSYTRPSVLTDLLSSLDSNWTAAALVPNIDGVRQAERWGFFRDNVAQWDTSNQRGFEDVGQVIQAATTGFMQNRALGVRGTRTLFQLNAPAPQQMTQAINQGVVQEMHPGQYRLLDVDYPEQIAPFVERKLNRPYRLGEAYYQVTKSEKVQPQKGVAIMDKKTHKLYSGVHARQLLGLPDYEVRVSPSFSQQYIIFVQSTSVNRNLLASTQLLIMS